MAKLFVQAKVIQPSKAVLTELKPLKPLLHNLQLKSLIDAMSPSEKGLEIGKRLNQFLREKKQIPHATPIIFNPRIQGWLNGFTTGFAEASDFNEKDTHSFISAVYINMFDGTSTGQRMGLDTLSERQRIMKAGSTIGYNTIYFEFIEKGKTDGKAYFSNTEHSLLLHTLLWKNCRYFYSD